MPGGQHLRDARLNEFWKQSLRKGNHNSASITNLPSYIPPKKYPFLSSSNYLRDIFCNKISEKNQQHVRLRPRSVNEKSTEDFADEISILKRKIAALSTENESLHFQCRLLQQTGIKKDKEIESLTNSTENSKLLKNLGDNRPQTLRNFRSLNQKIFKLESQLHAKEREYNRLVTDMKYTRVEELRAQLETAFNEISRLQAIVTNLEQSRNNVKKKKEDNLQRPQVSLSNECSSLRVRVATLSRVIKGLDEQRQELIAKNEYLMMELQKYQRRYPEMVETKTSPQNNAYENQVNSQVTEYFTLIANYFQNSDVLKSSQSNLVATAVETKLTHQSYQAKPTVMYTRHDNQILQELGSTRSQINELEHENESLREDKKYYKKQYQLVSKQLQAENFESNEAMKTTSKPQTRSRKSYFENAVTTEEESAILIQRAWRSHHKRCVLDKEKTKQAEIDIEEAKKLKSASIENLKSIIHGHMVREKTSAELKAEQIQELSASMQSLSSEQTQDIPTPLSSAPVSIASSPTKSLPFDDSLVNARAAI